MPKRTDIKTVMLIGSGPIVIGQACEFDYSGTQGVKALKEEGYRVVLVNSNPATIMTDPEMADRTYVEPLTVEVLTSVIERERPDALLPTLGGQTALNLALELHKAGVLAAYGVKLIGAQVEAIEKAEDRQLFKEAMAKIGLDVPLSGHAHSLEEARTIQAQMAAETGVAYPVLLRPSFTMGGSGAAIVWNAEEFDSKVSWGLAQSPRGEVLVEQSVLGWKEYELEVMRDTKDNAVIICSIENFDPMGVHTGDSITIAPAMTLTDKEYQIMRDAALAVIREIGVETGGSNIQFAINPENGRMIVIEMNPRVSRSSALASKATGFPIAKIATKLAIGYTLDEVPNDITRETPACFEPTIDYVVTKIPRFAFEKFPGADDELGPQMKSVGEVMAIGRTFKESFGKALRSMEIGRAGFDLENPPPLEELRRRIVRPGPDRLWQLAEALRAGLSEAEAFQLTKIDPWFLRHLGQMVAADEGARIAGAAKGAAMLDDAAGLLRLEAARHLRPAPHEARRRVGRGGPPGAHQARRPPGLQAGRHLRRRVRGADALPLLDLREQLRGDTSTASRSPRMRGGPRGRRRSSSSAAAPTGSARGSSSTTAASTPCRRCARTATRPSWSTATPRRSPPTTTPPTGCSSSR